MDAVPPNIGDCIEAALLEVEALMAAAFAELGGVAAGSALDQAGLADGGDVVREYLQAGEAELALEHLIYMVHEPSLPISARAFACIESAGVAMGMDGRLWEHVRPSGAADR